jgi:hypothetical protein
MRFLKHTTLMRTERHKPRLSLRARRRRFAIDLEGHKYRHIYSAFLAAPPSSKCLQRLSTSCDDFEQSAHFIFSTTFFVVFFLLWKIGLV